MKTLIIVLSVVISALIFAGCSGATAITKGYYTCSMHPQVVSEKPGNCPICGMELVKKETSVTQAQSNSTMDMNGNTTASATQADIPVIEASFTSLDAEVAAHIKKIVSNYLVIKDAMVSSDTSEIKKGASNLTETITRFDNSYFPFEQKQEYDKHRYQIKESAQQMVAGGNVEVQRGNFAELSKHVYELVKAFGTGEKLYYNHCNMAFDKNGAVWLSKTEEIKNPYMDSKMMTCGSVKQVLN